MRLASLLAFAGLLTVPSVASSAPETTEATAVVLVDAAGKRFRRASAVLSCPGRASRSLETDDKGRVELGDPHALTGCTIAVGRDGAAYQVKLDAEPTRGQRLTLERSDATRTIVVKTTPVRTDTAVGRTVSMEEFRNIPVGSSTSRDFTAVVTGAESKYTVEGASVRPHSSADSQWVGQGVSGFVPGTLTAGAVDDVDAPDGYRRFLKTVVGNVPEAASFRRPHRVLRVVDVDGRPVAGAVVEAHGQSYRTRRDGRLVVLPGWDPLGKAGQQARVPVGKSWAVQSELAKPLTTIKLAKRVDPLPPSVDVALVLDTTGSMGDELEYLKVELDHLLTKLRSQYSGLDVRWGLVVYRDHGDEYVARRVDFTRDFGHFASVLARQRADGGGDTPEAVPEALQAAEELAWRDPTVAGRVLIQVADAPPHPDRIGDTLKAVDRLRKAGTAFYPVAASGIDSTAEFTMRTAALMSGGQYVFLTDHSGVGGPHREVTATCYQVDSLINVMGKILEAELEGRRAKLPTGTEGKGCKRAKRISQRAARGGPARRRTPLDRSLMDDDGAAELLHRPRVIHRLP